MRIRHNVSTEGFEFDSRHGIRYRDDRFNVNLKEEETKRICTYLENPTRTGLWVLTAKWLKEKGISSEFISKINEILGPNEDPETQIGKRKVKTTKKAFLDMDPISDCGKLTFVFELFTFLIYLEKQNEPSSRQLIRSSNKQIFDLVDLDELKKKYSEAFVYFKDNIYFDGFDPAVRSEQLMRIKSGFFSFSDDEDPNPFEEQRPPEKKISLTSIDREPIENLKTFYEKLGKITDVYVAPIYSPEEEVFGPYFLISGYVYPHLISNESLERLFDNAVTEYKEEKYPHSIRTIGLIAEDYLIQVYETLFRDTCPKELTLGQVYDLIDRSVKKNQTKTRPLPDINHLFETINNISKKCQNDVEIETLKIIRELVVHVKDERKQIQSVLKSAENEDDSLSVFPKRTRDDIIELIRYRNAASHKSRVPLGDYEAIRTAYCCIALITWWNNEKKQIEWNDNESIIIKKMIQRNNPIHQSES